MKVSTRNNNTHKQLIKIMTIAKDFASKAAIAFVAVAMIFSMFAPAARAQSSEELQAMINTLLAQIAALQGQVGGSTASAVCPYTWTRDLNVGATGADVKMLQMFLNSNADTRVSVSGAGSAGMETETFGPATAAAVSKFQVMHRADILTPAGLVNPTGYFGPSTRAKANSLCAAAPVVVPGDEDEDTTDEDTDSSELSGEASLEDSSLDSASDDDIEEGATDAEVAEFKVEFTDGDAEISRLDVKFDSGDASDAWDVLDTVSLWVDGDMVAEMDASNEDDFQNDEMTLRFSGLNIVAMEDEELEIVIAASLQNNIDNDDQDTYTVTVESLRFFDADGVATTESADLTADEATFNVVEAGFEDEIIVRDNDNDPTSMTLGLEDDAKSDWFTVFAFDLDTDDSTNDIEVNDTVVRLAVGNSTGGYDALVDDVELVIDGVTIDDVAVTGTTNGDGTAVLTFDVDGDVVIEAGDRVEAELNVRFRALTGANEGATILASVNDNDVEGEGADDVVSDGSATGEQHTLRTVGLSLKQTTTSATVVNNSDNVDESYGTFKTKLELTTVGDEDLYIPETSNRGASTTVGVAYVIENAETGAIVTTGTTSATFKRISGGSKSGNFWKIAGDGGTAVFELNVASFNPATAGTFRVQILSVGFNATSAATPDDSETASPDYDFEGEDQFIQS